MESFSNSAAGYFTTFLFHHRTPSALKVFTCKEYSVANVAPLVGAEPVGISLTVYYFIQLFGKTFILPWRIGTNIRFSWPSFQLFRIIWTNTMCLVNVVYQNRLTMSSITLELKIIIIIIKKFIHNYLFAYVMFFICFEVFPSQLLSSLLAQTNDQLKLSSQLRSMWRISLDENNTYAFHEVKFDAETSVDCIKYSRYVMFCMLCSASRDLETVDSHHRSKKINFSLFSTFFMLESYK